MRANWPGAAAASIARYLRRVVPSFLHTDAHISLDSMIRVVNQSPSLTNGMKLANLMGDTRPEFSNGL